MNAVIWAVLVVSVAAFARSAWTSTGLAYRLVMSLYFRINPLTAFQRSGTRHASLKAVVSTPREPVVERLIRRAVPQLTGWFSSFPTDKGGFHDYLTIYEMLLLPYRNREGLMLLEVGVNKGGSLAMWREYFPADATIYGIDVHSGVQTFPCDAGIKVLILDSRDVERVRDALRGLEFHIIIDDGLHDPESQTRTFEALRPCLSPTGVYVIEDVYSFDAEHFSSYGDTVQRYEDRCGQELVVLRPPGCEAGDPSEARRSSSS